MGERKMEENNNKKICPFCGAEINSEAKKCRFCNNWLDEEIQCPFCAEKIKASAKKCRFCGEWLDGNSDTEKKNSNKKEYSQNINKIDFPEIKNLPLILGITAVVIVLTVSVVCFFTYIPSCKSSNMQAKLKEYLTANYSDIENINLDKTSAHKIKRIEKGYSCAINAYIDDTPTSIEYSYKKVSLNEFDINAKFVLPNCYDSSVKKLLHNLIKDYDYYNIKNNTSDVYTNYEVQNNYDKDSVTYSCSADATLTSKPGKAFVLNSWSYDDATRQIECKVDYRTYFCKNGYATCVGLSNLYSCEYKED